MKKMRRTVTACLTATALLMQGLPALAVAADQETEVLEVSGGLQEILEEHFMPGKVSGPKELLELYAVLKDHEQELEAGTGELVPEALDLLQVSYGEEDGWLLLELEGVLYRLDPVSGELEAEEPDVPEVLTEESEEPAGEPDAEEPEEPAQETEEPETEETTEETEEPETEVPETEEPEDQCHGDVITIEMPVYYASGQTKVYTQVSVLTGNSDQKIAALKAAYPTGKYWNHASTSSHVESYRDTCNNPEGVTSTPCKGHFGGTSSTGCNIFSYLDGVTNTIYNCKQCAGFAAMCSYKYTGNVTSVAPSRLQDKSKLSQLKTGDILYIKTDSGTHYAFVWKVSGNTIYTGEANHGLGSDVNSCRIEWRTRNKTDADILGYFSSTVVKVSSVTLNKTSASLDPGKTLQLTASVAPANAEVQTLSWSSSNSNIASVSESGLVTAYRPGQAVITATAKDGSGKTASCTITVSNKTVLVSSVSMNSTASVAKGASIDLKATVQPSYATNSALTWTTSNSAVATVSASGKVTGVKAGTAIITATAKDGSGKAASCKVTVTETVQTVDMYRLYNKVSGEHFYTANAKERDFLKTVGWIYEGVGWKAPATSNTPVYRLYNPNSGDHHYTTNKSEHDFLVKMGWKSEGIGWYSDDNKGVALYRQFNPNVTIGSHNYTTDKNENDFLVKIGWKAEGVGWYGVK